MSVVRASLGLSIANSYVGLLLQVASTVVISRILTPAELGVFAVATVFAALASTFRDFGVAEYLIQKKTITHDDLRASFTINLAVSWFVGLVLMVIAPLASDFYNEPGVGRVMRIQAMNFALIPFGAVTMAWHRREMNFKPILVAGIAANSVSFVVAVGMALLGFSYMSLAWSAFSGVAATIAVAIWYRPSWFPRKPGLHGIGEVFHFGKFASAVFVVGQLGKGAPELIIGKITGMGDVGMFSRAAGLVEMFNRLVINAISPVSLPFLATGVRRDGSVIPALMQTTTLITGVGWPFLVFLGMAAFPAIRIMYGPQWTEAVAVAQFLCAAASIELLFRYSNQALFALGNAPLANRTQLVVQGLRVMGLLAVIPFGLLGAAGGLVVAAGLGVVFVYRVLVRHAGLTLPVLWRAAWPSLRLTAFSILPFALVVAWWPPSEENYLIVGPVGGVLTAAAWLCAARGLRHPAWSELVRAFAALRARLPF